jgi:hypothetical protein
MEKDEHVQPFDREIARGHPAWNEADEDCAQQIGDDQDGLFGQSIQVDADERTENNGRNSLEHADDRRLDRRPRDRIDEPEECEFGDAVTHLGDQLPPPD